MQPTVFITGATSGFGEACARRFAQAGWKLVITGRRTERLDALAAELSPTTEVLALTLDVRDRAAMQAAIDALPADFAKLRGLVNNAGLITMSSLEDLTDDEWDLVLDVNLKGVYITTQLAVPYFRKANRGAVVNLSTVEADVVVSSQGFAQVHYNASKGGVKMLTKALAVELSRYNVRVNAIAPGPVPTNFLPGVDLNSPEVLEVRDSRLLVKRLGKPEDMAAAVSFLLSDDASYISGAQLPVDGGWLTR